eukprot:SAG31_NODE_841_length_11595_cov_3.739388_3_plen_1000_part_00
MDSDAGDLNEPPGQLILVLVDATQLAKQRNWLGFPGTMDAYIQISIGAQVQARSQLDDATINQDKVRQSEVRADIEEGARIDFEHEELNFQIDESDATPNGQYLVKVEAKHKMANGTDDQIIGSSRVLDMYDLDWFSANARTATTQVELFGDDLNAGVCGTVSIRANFSRQDRDAEEENFEEEGDTDEMEHYNALLTTRDCMIDRWSQLISAPLPASGAAARVGQARQITKISHAKSTDSFIENIKAIGCAALFGNFNRNQAEVRTLQEKLANTNEAALSWITPYWGSDVKSSDIKSTNIKGWVQWEFADGAQIALDKYLVSLTSACMANDPKSWVLVASCGMNEWDTLSVFNKPGMKKEKKKGTKIPTDVENGSTSDTSSGLESFVERKWNDRDQKNNNDGENQHHSVHLGIDAVDGYSLGNVDNKSKARNHFKKLEYFTSGKFSTTDLVQATSELDRLKSESKSNEMVQHTWKGSDGSTVTFQERPNEDIQELGKIAVNSRQSKIRHEGYLRMAHRLFAAQKRMPLSNLEKLLTEVDQACVDYPAQGHIMKAASNVAPDGEGDDMLQTSSGPTAKNVIGHLPLTNVTEPQPEVPSSSLSHHSKQIGLYSKSTFNSALSMWNPQLMRTINSQRHRSEKKNVLLSVIDVQNILSKLQELLRKNTYKIFKLYIVDVFEKTNNMHLQLGGAILVEKERPWDEDQPVKLRTDTEASHDASQGSAEDSLKQQLNPQKVVVRAYILEAKDLMPKDADGKAEPYIESRLGQLTHGSAEDAKHSLNPQLRKMHEFHTQLPGPSKLELTLWDDDTVGRELIGTTVIDLEDRWFCGAWRDTSYTRGGPIGQKPIEWRTLRVSSSKASQGQLRLWVDIMKFDEALNIPAKNISRPAGLPYELRLVVYSGEDLPCQDWISSQNDAYVTCELIGQRDDDDGSDFYMRKETDVHWRCQAVDDGRCRFFPPYCGHCNDCCARSCCCCFCRCFCKRRCCSTCIKVCHRRKVLML